MLVGPWAGEEESAQSVLKEDDLRGKRERQRLAQTDGALGTAMGLQGAEHCRGCHCPTRKPSLEDLSAQEPPALPGEGSALRSPGGTRLRCITPSALKPNQTGQHPKNSTPKPAVHSSAP